MTPEQVIRAGAIASKREKVRDAFRGGRLASIHLKVANEVTILHLSSAEARDVLNALDLYLTGELEKLGVSECSV